MDERRRHRADQGGAVPTPRESSGRWADKPPRRVDRCPSCGRAASPEPGATEWTCPGCGSATHSNRSARLLARRPLIARVDVERGINETRMNGFALILTTGVAVGLAVGVPAGASLGVLSGVVAAAGAALLLALIY